MNDVVIASAARTAIGTFGGGLSALTGAELGEEGGERDGDRYDLQR